jgi:hypothetical protein
MIHFISRYFYEVQRNKVEMLTRAEKKRAFWLLSGLAVCVTILVFLWLK